MGWKFYSQNFVPQIVAVDLGMHISRANVIKEEKDVQVWRGDESGCFTVSSAYKCLAKSKRAPQIDVFK